MSLTRESAPAPASGPAGVLREAVRTLRPPAGDRHGPLAPMLVALTFVTGVVDAVSYLELGHVFVANMTGNVVFLGFAIAGASGLSTPTSLVAICSFLLGALIGSRMALRRSSHRGRMLRTASAAQALLIALALVLALVVRTPLDAGARYSLVVALALAMGIQNAAALRLAIPDLATTVLTRTLTGLASESRLAGGPGARLGRRSVAIAAMLLGAIAGGLLALDVSIPAALALACATVAAVSLAVHLASRGGQRAWTRA